MLTTLIGLLLFFTFSFLSVIHFYWGLGGKWGANAAIPTNANKEKVMNPRLFECFVVAFGLLGFGLFILVKTKILSFYFLIIMLTQINFPRLIVFPNKKDAPLAAPNSNAVMVFGSLNWLQAKTWKHTKIPFILGVSSYS